MSPEPTPDDFLAQLHEFVDRVDRLDPRAPVWAHVTIAVEGRQSVLTIRGPVARALVAALREYRDPRDVGRCDHCADGRVDENLMCRDCGRPNGVFGQIVMERAARHSEPEALAPGP